MSVGEERRKRADAAFRIADLYKRELREIFQYFMPYRLPTWERAGQSGFGSEGARRGDLLFDSTGVAGAFAFAGRLQSDWLPLGEPFFKLETGPLFARGDAKKLADEALQIVTDVTTSVLSATVPQVAHEFAFDLFAGTGAMLLLKGDARSPIRVLNVPVMELAIENGPFGDIWRVWWKRTYRYQDIPDAWPGGKISDKLSRQIKASPTDQVAITQHTAYDPKDGVWRHMVWADNDDADALIDEDTFLISPWTITRFFTAPGETFGRGLGHLSLASVKSANKGREMALTAAAMAVMGVFLYRNDGIFNPETATFAPLSMWPVASTGGALGSSIQRLDVPSNFDITSVVMAEEREQINKLLLNDELPPEDMAVRSATEIAGRLRRYSRQWGGVNARLGAEWIVPMVRRAVHILEDKGIFAGVMSGLPYAKLEIDQLVFKASVVAPAMATQKAARVENAINYLQMMQMILGPQAPMLVTRIEQLLPDIGRWMAVDEQHIRSQDEMKDLQEMVKSVLAQAEQAKTAGPPPPQAVAQSFANGVPLQ